MNSGYYAATSGLMARMQALDVAANNLANTGTTGFKAQHAFYRAMQASMLGVSGSPPNNGPIAATLAGGAPTDARLSPVNRAINNFGMLGGATVDYSQGSLERTGNDLDLAIDGGGFFAVQSPSGAAYTRNGSFSLGPHGELLTSTGVPVLGKNGPIQLPPGQVYVGSAGDISVNGKIIDQLQIVEFAQSSPPAALGNTLFSAPSGTGQPATASKVAQGFLESSNISAIGGATGLVELQRQAEMLQRALTIFHNEFNRTAVQDLSKTS